MAKVVQHHQGVEAEEGHHLQMLQAEEAEEEHLQVLRAVEAAVVVHLVPQKQVQEEGEVEVEALRGHPGPEAEGAGGHRVLQNQAAEAGEVGR